GCAIPLTGNGPHGWRLLLLGLLAGSLPLVRPADLILSSIVVLFVLITRMRRRNLWATDIAWLAIGAAVVILPYFALYISIYGLHLTPDMLVERDTGFVFSRLGWKTYLLLVAPRPWYPQGVSLLALFPWLLFSFAELALLVIGPRQGWPGRSSLLLLGALIV